MGYALPHVMDLDSLECCVCGTPFAMSRNLMQIRREDGKWFYCPIGHQQHFTETDVQRLKAKLQEQTRVATQMAERARAAEEAEQKTKDEMARMKKRAAAGVCPCCSRTFRQLALHMKNKHPSYIPAPQANALPREAQRGGHGTRNAPVRELGSEFVKAKARYDKNQERMRKYESE